MGLKVLFVERVKAEDGVVGLGDPSGDEGGDGKVEVGELDEVDLRRKLVGFNAVGEVGGFLDAGYGVVSDGVCEEIDGFVLAEVLEDC